MDNETYAWMDAAGCKGNALLFDAAADALNQAQNEIVKAAKAICLHHCPVTLKCLEYALRTGQFGVWGGTTLYARNQAGGARAVASHPSNLSGHR